MLDEALMDKFLNPEDWRCANAQKPLKYMPKQIDLMNKTGLCPRQIRYYMHNNARKGKRMAEILMEGLQSKARQGQAKR